MKVKSGINCLGMRQYWALNHMTTLTDIMETMEGAGLAGLLLNVAL